MLSLEKDNQSIGKVLAVTGVSMLVLMWCVLDNWNLTLTKSLFELGVAEGTQDHHEEATYFKSPMLLTLIEFLFMGAAFTGLWLASTERAREDVSAVTASVYTAPWPLLLTTYVFSSFWLQSLMMPSQVMSLGFFAATRAAEVPIAAMLRSLAFALPCGGHRPRTIAAMTAANMAMYYAYLQMEGCLCIWSGQGVSLDGTMLYLMYGLMLAIPAVHVISQEAVLVQHGVNPILLLAIQNVFGALITSPVLLLEPVRTALAMLLKYPEVALLTCWLCVQMAASALVGIALLHVLGSFWTISLRGLRVVYWWACQLIAFYVSTNTLLSVAHPSMSLWSMLMALGLMLVISTLLTDARYPLPRSIAKTKDKGLLYTEATKV